MSVIDIKKDLNRFEKMPPALAARIIRYVQHDDSNTPLPEKREGKRVITRKIARNIARRAMKDTGILRMNRHEVSRDEITGVLKKSDSFFADNWREYYIRTLADDHKRRKRKTA